MSLVMAFFGLECNSPLRLKTYPRRIAIALWIFRIRFSNLQFRSPTQTLVNVASVEMLPMPIPIPNWKLATLELDIFTLATFTNSNSNSNTQTLKNPNPEQECSAMNSHFRFAQQNCVNGGEMRLRSRHTLLQGRS